MISKTAIPFAYALIVTGIICAFSINAGAAINPVCKFYIFICKILFSVFFLLRLVIWVHVFSEHLSMVGMKYLVYIIIFFGYRSSVQLSEPLLVCGFTKVLFG
jgi:hypothetical protein